MKIDKALCSVSPRVAAGCFILPSAAAADRVLAAAEFKLWSAPMAELKQKKSAKLMVFCRRAVLLGAALGCLAAVSAAQAVTPYEAAQRAMAQQSGGGSAAGGAGAAPAATGPSGLPLPRFVTLKSNHANMRVGPDQGKYPISWTYKQRGLPVEILQEYDNWRRIRDVDGTVGWVNAGLLSGKRGAIITPKGRGLSPLYAEPSAQARVVIKAEAGVIARVEECDGVWCELSIDGNHGYIQQTKLWGVYPHEVIKD